jgi:hypothetical protein
MILRVFLHLIHHLIYNIGINIAHKILAICYDINLVNRELVNDVSELTKKKEHNTQAAISQSFPSLKSIMQEMRGPSAPSQNAKRKVKTL